MRHLAFVSAWVATLTVTAGAWPLAARKTNAPGAALGTAVLAMGRSVGSPTAGHLVGGSRLPEAPYLRVVPAYAQGEVRWGLGSLVGMIDRAARRVRKDHPDAVLSVGHLSRQGGGEVDRHVSHESGRDADIAFYVRNAQGKQIFAEHFVQFHGDGTASSWPGAFFDDARNWALVRALVTDPQARVTHIFVATPLRARLLAYAAKSGAPVELRDRAALVMVQPHGALPHDDHFHVRISCPAWQRECVEIPVKKKPALVARVPTPKGRARAFGHESADAAKLDRSHHDKGPAKTEHEHDKGHDKADDAVAKTDKAAERSTPNDKPNTAHKPAPEKADKSPADEAPPASLVVPVTPAEAPAGGEVIDDVDGPM